MRKRTTSLVAAAAVSATVITGLGVSLAQARSSAAQAVASTSVQVHQSAQTTGKAKKKSRHIVRLGNVDSRRPYKHGNAEFTLTFNNRSVTIDGWLRDTSRGTTTVLDVTVFGAPQKPTGSSPVLSDWSTKTKTVQRLKATLPANVKGGADSVLINFHEANSHEGWESEWLGR